MSGAAHASASEVVAVTARPESVGTGPASFHTNCTSTPGQAAHTCSGPTRSCSVMPGYTSIWIRVWDGAAPAWADSAA